MAIKINAKILGITKLVEVKETSKNVQRALLIQKDLVKTEYESKKLAEKDELEITQADIDNQLDLQFALLDSINEFTAKALRLNDKQIEKLEEDTEQNDVMELASEIISGLLHIEATTDGEVADKSLTD